MTGDQTDMLRRLRMGLPTRWFGDVAPVLDGILSGFACSWSGLYDLLQFVVIQSRIITSTDVFLELAAQDYLSDSFPRRPDELENDFRHRLLLAMGRQRATLQAVVSAAESAGYSLRVFEPAQPVNTGAYNVPVGLAWNRTGGWGSLQMPCESLVVATPQGPSYEKELWQNIGNAAPAGGAIWLRVNGSTSLA